MRLWRELPPQVRELVHQRVQRQLPDVVHRLTDEIADHIDQLVDVKLMVIKRFDPELANRVFLDMGRREFKFIQNFGFFFGFVLGIPVAAITHFVTFWWLLPILGVVVGYVTNWVALWMIYEPPEPRKVGPFRLQGPLPWRETFCLPTRTRRPLLPRPRLAISPRRPPRCRPPYRPRASPQPSFPAAM